MASETLYAPPLLIREPDVSVVIPAYREALRLGPTLEATLGYLDKQYPDDYAVTVVDDGSPDETIAVAESYGVNVIPLGRNQGKGAAVRTGLLGSPGLVRAFMDADGSIAIGEVDRLIGRVAEGGADVAIATRQKGEHLGSDSAVRKLGHFAFDAARNALLPVHNQAGGRLRDTQCGAKAYSRPAAELIFSRQRSDGFSADVEALYIADRQDLRIAEVPVHVQNDERTTVRPVRDGARMLADLVAIRRRHRRA